MPYKANQHSIRKIIIKNLSFQNRRNYHFRIVYNEMKSSNEFTIIHRAIRALELRGLLHCFDILLCRVLEKNIV